MPQPVMPINFDTITTYCRSCLTGLKKCCRQTVAHVFAVKTGERYDDLFLQGLPFDP
nr:hypothetical protein SHINE37_60078 [Rhizobiaceae bacterium]